jgi:outer membrane protein assembly factor BamB
LESILQTLRNLPMKTSLFRLRAIAGTAVAVCAMLVSVAPASAQSQWLAFRGDGGRGEAMKSKPPTDFDVPAGKNLAWKTATTGRGIGGPLVIGDLVVVTGCDGEDERDIHIEGFNAKTGKREWVRSMRSTGRPYTHPTSANASPTPASDGQRIFALFSSCDLVCVDLQGRLQWFRGLAIDHPKTGNDISMSSSPAVIDGVVVVQLENQGDSFVAGLDAQSGETLWQMPRDRQSNWATPLPITIGDGRSAFVLQDGGNLMIVDARTGKVEHDFAIKCDRTASASYAAPMIIVPGEETVALRTDSSGVEEVWRSNKLRPQRCSPVIADGKVYMGRGSVLIAGNLVDGEVVWQKRLPGVETVWATPVATGSGIFVLDANGNVAVVRDDGDSAEVISQPVIGESILASPAVVGDALFLRTERAVIKIAEQSTEES